LDTGAATRLAVYSPLVPKKEHLAVQHVSPDEITAVLIHKLDRLSRSRLDFARIMEIFEKYHVSFVCITQQF
jgi:DNA invertase Pin-like site-specific DNA recombinase